MVGVRIHPTPLELHTRQGKDLTAIFLALYTGKGKDRPDQRGGQGAPRHPLDMYTREGKPPPRASSDLHTGECKALPDIF